MGERASHVYIGMPVALFLKQGGDPAKLFGRRGDQLRDDRSRQIPFRGDIAKLLIPETLLFQADERGIIGFNSAEDLRMSLSIHRIGISLQRGKMDCIRHQGNISKKSE